MMDEIIEQLDLECRIKDIRNKIVVSYEEDTGLIYLTAEGEDPEIAFHIAESLVDGLQKRVKELFGQNYLKVVDTPYIPSEPSRPSIPLNMAIAAVFAILLFTLIFIWDTKCR